jgi:hypothetical protein
MRYTWIYIAAGLPEDGSTCYIRLANNEFYPDLCIYSAPLQQFTVKVSGAKFPINQVLKWCALL